MKITRKENKFTEDMLNDMYAEKLLEKYFKEKYSERTAQGYLSLCAWVDKDTGNDYCYDITLSRNYKECKDDNDLNRILFADGRRLNCYSLFITGQRIVLPNDKAIIVLIEAEAIER